MLQCTIKNIGSDWHMSKVAASSGVKAATSGEAGVDVERVTELAVYYYRQLGLDESSLKLYAERTSTDYEELKSIVGDECKKCVNEQTFGGYSLLSKVLKRVPGVGPMAVTSGGTYCTLDQILKRLENAARDVVKFAIKHSDG